MLFTACVFALLAAQPPAPAPDPSTVPPTAPAPRRQEKVTELHGERLVDDYAWMREKGTPAVEDHLKAEDAYARALLAPTEPLQQALYAEMLGRLQQTDTEVPHRDRGFYYYQRTEEGKQYPILARRRGTMQAPEEVILDVNALAAGKAFIGLGDTSVSPDGRLLAYTTDETGYRQYTLHVKDLGTGALRPETAERVTSLEWTQDGKALVYGVEDATTKRSFQVLRHPLGGAPALVYEEKDPRFNVGVYLSRDRNYLFVGSSSLTTSEVRFAPAATGLGPWTLVAPREQDHQYDVEHREGLLWIVTNDTGRNFRLVTAPVSAPGRASWKEVVAHRDDVMLSGLSLFRDFYVLHERSGGFPRLRVTTFADGGSHLIDVPEPASVIGRGVNAEFDTRLFRFRYESPVTPPSTYDYDPAARTRTLLKQQVVEGGWDPSRYAVEVLQAPAADGARIPIWTLRRKDLAADGSHAALLYGYGSYGAPMSAYFNPNVFSLVDRGVVFAMAYVRGGGELGKAWHDAGRMANKKTTFSDFVAAAEHLVATGWTRPERLAITGGSAGGLLVGATLNLRPDLFRAAIAHVPFVDVINTMMDETLPLTVAEFEEWGNPRIEEQYRWIRAYSPYENVAARRYPSLLVRTSYNDSQVPYWEAAKWVARLRDRKADPEPVLLLVNMGPAGHGGRSGRYDRLRDLAVDYAFLLTRLGVEAPVTRP